MRIQIELFSPNSSEKITRDNIECR